MGIGTVGYNRDAYHTGYDRNHAADSSSKDKKGSRDLFQEAVQKFCDDNQITAKELKEEKNWREMSDEEWDDMLEGLDEYIDAFKERLRQIKEMQDEAARKAALEADSDMRTTAASSAALKVAANGLGGASKSEAETSAQEDEKHDKNWTKNLTTDDQTVLRTAQEAQKMEKMAMSKFQEVQLTDSTSAGISRTEAVLECASVKEEEEKEKVWTVTAFTEDGIISRTCKNGKVIDGWELKYQNPGDYEKVKQLLSAFQDDENLVFAGDKTFWEEFLAGRTSMNDLIRKDDGWYWQF